MAKKQKKAAVTKNDTSIIPAGGCRVTAKVDGFRRGGIVHHGTAIYGPDDLTNEQIAAIKNEPLLVLEQLDAERDETENITPENQGVNNQVEGVRPAEPVGAIANQQQN